MKDSKKLLYTDDKAEIALNNRVSLINSQVKTLQSLFKDTTGSSSESLQELLDNGSKGFLEAFIKNYGSMFPPIANMQLIFQQQTGVTTGQIDGKIKAIKDLIKKNGNNVNVGKKLVKANVYEETYKRYLDDKKAEDYYLAKELLEVVENVKAKHKYSGHAHIQRFAPMSWYRTDGNKLSLNLQYFAAKW